MHRALVWGIHTKAVAKFASALFTWLEQPFCKFLCQHKGLLSLVLRCKPCSSAGTWGETLLLSNFGCKGFFSNLFLIGPDLSLPHLWKHERRGSSFSQLGLEPNHTGLTAQSLFFLEESCRVKRSDTQTFSNFSNYFKRVLKLQKRSSSFSK